VIDSLLADDPLPADQYVFQEAARQDLRDLHSRAREHDSGLMKPPESQE